MFEFMRSRSGATEVWDILITADGATNLGTRFGSPVRVDTYEDFFHEVGRLFIIHDGERSEFLLSCHMELTEDERFRLLREVTLLVGRTVFSIGNEFEACWVLHDEIGPISIRAPL